MKPFRSNLQKPYKESQYWIWALLFIIIILSLSPFFKIGITSSDDLDYYIRALLGNESMDAEYYAKHQGRFFFLITKPLYSIPYLIDNFYFTKTVQHGLLLLCFILFTMVISKVFKQKEFSILIFLLLFSLLFVSKPMYLMPFIAYPFIFTFSFSLVLLSALFLLKYYETTQYKYLITASLIFTLGLLFYETYLLFLALFCLYIFFQNTPKSGKRIFTNKLFYKEVTPFILVGILYISVYFLYRKSIEIENFYTGTNFASEFSFLNFFKIITNYTRAALPTFTYFDSQGIIAANSLLETGHQNNFWYILTHTKISSLVNTLLQCFVFFFLCNKMDDKISWKKIRISFIVSVLIFFFIHTFIGISEKYNSDIWWVNLRGYVTTFYSYFCIVLFLGLLFYSAIKACYKNTWIKKSVIGFFTILLFFISILIGYSNEHLSRDWQRGQTSLKIFDEVLKKGIFDELPDDAVVYSAQLHSTSSIMASQIYNKSTIIWRYYLYAKTKQTRILCDDMNDFQENFTKNAQRDFYYITKYEAPTSNDILLILLKLNPNSLLVSNGEENIFKHATATQANVYYYSNEKQFTFSFFIPEYSLGSSFYINGIAREATHGFNIATIKNDDQNEAITSFILKSDQPFSVERFMVSKLGFSMHDAICVLETNKQNSKMGE